MVRAFRHAAEYVKPRVRYWPCKYSLWPLAPSFSQNRITGWRQFNEVRGIGENPMPRSGELSLTTNLER